MKKCGVSLCGEEISEKYLSDLKAGGVDCIEISAYELKSYEGIGDLCAKYGIEPWSAHLPFGYDIDISSLEGSISDDTAELDIKIMERVSREGFRVCVIHPSSEPIEEKDRKARMEMAKSKLRVLAEKAHQLGMILAVEDLPRTCLGRNSIDILELLSADSRLKVCFDTNHLLGESIENFIRKVGRYIVTTHISDYDFIDERHLLPGEGDIDWVSFADEMEKIGYEGPILYEVSPGTTNRIERPVALTPKDYKENYECMLKREKLPEHNGRLLFK